MIPSCAAPRGGLTTNVPPAVIVAPLRIDYGDRLIREVVLHSEVGSTSNAVGEYNLLRPMRPTGPHAPPQAPDMIFNKR
jgi:hypothetical protein